MKAGLGTSIYELKRKKEPDPPAIMLGKWSD
jgi:hypothetical protein